MTNKEAIEIISRYEVNGCGYCHQGGDEIPEAFNMAINALKAQEPHVMTIDEVLENAGNIIGFPCWVEDHIEDIGVALLFPAFVTSNDTYVRYTGSYEGAIYHWAYNKRLRCWTSRPTDEQRKEVKWE